MKNAGLDREELLEHLSRYFRGKAEVLQVYLFGSWARGTSDSRSDVDLIVIGDFSERFFDRYDRFRDLLTGTPLAIDLLPYTPGEWRELRERLFFRGLLRHAVTLYERGAA